MTQEKHGPFEIMFLNLSISKSICISLKGKKKIKNSCVSFILLTIFSYMDRSDRNGCSSSAIQVFFNLICSLCRPLCSILCPSEALPYFQGSPSTEKYNRRVDVKVQLDDMTELTLFSCCQMCKILLPSSFSWFYV